MKSHQILTVALGVALLMAFTGCDRSAKELDKAKADLASVQAELTALKAKVAKTDANLAEMTKERDSLKDTLEKTKAELSSITEQRDKLQTLADTLTKGKVAAAPVVDANSKSTIEQLTTQLNDQTQKSQTYAEKIKQLEALIETLKSQLAAKGISMPKF